MSKRERDYQSYIPFWLLVLPSLCFTADIPVPDVNKWCIDPGKMMSTYADVVGIFFSFRCEYDAADGIQESLHLLDNWPKVWNIEINTSKCTNMRFNLRIIAQPAVQRYCQRPFHMPTK